MTGCITVNVNRVDVKGNVSFDREGGSADIDCICCNDINVDVSNKNSNMSALALMHPTGKAEASRVSGNISVSFGIVCSTYLGYDILYASDGALITINGKYLMVKKKKK